MSASTDVLEDDVQSSSFCFASGCRAGSTWIQVGQDIFVEEGDHNPCCDGLEYGGHRCLSSTFTPKQKTVSSGRHSVPGKLILLPLTCIAGAPTPPPPQKAKHRNSGSPREGGRRRVPTLRRRICRGALDICVCFCCFVFPRFTFKRPMLQAQPAGLTKRDLT